MLQILAQKVRLVLKYGEEQRGEQAGRLLRVAEMRAPGHRAGYGFGAAQLQLGLPRRGCQQIYIVMRASATINNLPQREKGLEWLEGVLAH